MGQRSSHSLFFTDLVEKPLAEAWPAFLPAQVRLGTVGYSCAARQHASWFPIGSLLFWGELELPPDRPFLCGHPAHLSPAFRWFLMGSSAFRPCSSPPERGGYACEIGRRSLRRGGQSRRKPVICPARRSSTSCPSWTSSRPCGMPCRERPGCRLLSKKRGKLIRPATGAPPPLTDEQVRVKNFTHRCER